MIIVGFGSKARQGKDSAAEAVVLHFQRKAHREKEYYGEVKATPTARIYKFAEALYEECRRDYGMQEKDAPLLQRVGSERRAQDPEYWIKKAFEKIKAEKVGIAILTDVRYKNEARYVKEQGGMLINVSRLNVDGSPFIADDRPADHPSEIDLDEHNWDFYIRAHSGQQVLVGELAITIVEHIRGIL